MILLFVLDVAANELMNDKGEYSIQSKNFTKLMMLLIIIKNLHQLIQ